MLTLHHAPRTRSSRILWLMEELEAPYELKLTDIVRMDGSGALDRSNPHPDKKVPALVHDGALITESIAIIQYLTDLFPGRGLAPTVGDPQRGPYLSWLAYYAGVIEPVIVVQHAGQGDAAWAVRSWRNVAAMHARVSAALAEQPYILGQRFSAVDLLITSMGQFMRHTLPPGAAVDDYIQRCTERPALRRALAKENG